jgi:hypothetical protein
MTQYLFWYLLSPRLRANREVSKETGVGLFDEDEFLQVFSTFCKRLTLEGLGGCCYGQSERSS